MSTTYKSSKDVPSYVLADRLDELARVVTNRNCAEVRLPSEFSMSVPAEPDRDADLVMAEAARRLRAA